MISPGLGSQVRIMGHGLGGTCHLGDAHSAAVSGVKGELSGEDGPAGWSRDQCYGAGTSAGAS